MVINLSTDITTLESDLALYKEARSKILLNGQSFRKGNFFVQLAQLPQIEAKIKELESALFVLKANQ